MTVNSDSARRVAGAPRIGYRVKWGQLGRSPEVIGWTNDFNLTSEEARANAKSVQEHALVNGFDWWVAIEKWELRHVGTELMPDLAKVER